VEEPRGLLTRKKWKHWDNYWEMLLKWESDWQWLISTCNSSLSVPIYSFHFQFSLFQMLIPPSLRFLECIWHTEISFRRVPAAPTTYVQVGRLQIKTLLLNCKGVLLFTTCLVRKRNVWYTYAMKTHIIRVQIVN